MLDDFDDIRLRDLIFFDLLAELGTITAAARELEIPKPTASRWLASLESKTGQQLMFRRSRQVVPTTHGQALLSQIKLLMPAIRTLRATMNDKRPQGTVRVSVPLPLRRLVGGSVIGEYRRRLPGVRLEILIQNEQVDLIRDRVDLAIRRGPSSDSNLVTEHLAEVPLWLYAGSKTIGSAVEAGGLIVAPGDEALLQQTMPALLPAAVVVDDRTLVRDALLEGAGVGILPAFLGEQPRADGDLRRLGDTALSTLQVEAASLPEQQADLRIRVLLELITTELRDLLGIVDDPAATRGTRPGSR